jgi:riboflavin synthase
VFTGLIADIGVVERADPGEDGARLRVRTKLAAQLAAGDSIAVNGVCLTAAVVEGDAFEADAMNATLERTSLGPLGAGDRVNLELALRADDRLGGHVVQGHVDGAGQVEDVIEDGFARRLRISVPSELLRRMVERGSVAIDGVSLTISALHDEDDSFEVSLIPETLERTTLGGAAPGRTVNIECDVIAKYIERLVGESTGQ